MTDDRLEYDQATWTADDRSYEPLLSEKNTESVEVDSPLPDDLTRDDVELPSLSEPGVVTGQLRLRERRQLDVVPGEVVRER